MSDQIASMLDRFACLYAAEAAASVARNSHMNDLRGDASGITVERARAVADAIGVETMRRHAGGEMALPILKTMAEAAGALYSKACAPEQAVAVDFVNYTGMRWGIDFALCTQDLAKAAS